MTNPYHIGRTYCYQIEAQLAMNQAKRSLPGIHPKPFCTEEPELVKNSAKKTMVGC